MSEQGRPSAELLHSYNAPRLSTRVVDELIGIARGITADGVITDGELEMLVRWLVANRHVTEDPIIAGLYRRIQAMLADGVFDEAKRRELLETLEAFTGPRSDLGEVTAATAIPFTKPEPMLHRKSTRSAIDSSKINALTPKADEPPRKAKGRRENARLRHRVGLSKNTVP
jgi:hypothetical protein